MGKFPPMPKEVAEQMKSRAPYGFSPSGIYDLHHSILKKSDMMGLSEEEQLKAHSVYNLLRIPHEHHASHADIPSRLTAIAEICNREGYDNVRAWYEDINFKSRPFIFPEREEVQ